MLILTFLLDYNLQHTSKNFSHNNSNGNDPGLININAILGLLDSTDGRSKTFLIITREAVSASLNSLAGGGSQLYNVLQLEDKII